MSATQCVGCARQFMWPEGKAWRDLLVLHIWRKFRGTDPVGLCSVRKIWARLFPGVEQRNRIGRTYQSFPECKLRSWGKRSVLPAPETETDISCEIPESYGS
jgi:hypothetical protein